MRTKKITVLLMIMVLVISCLTGCGSATDGKRIVRIGHNQSTNHPSHKGLVAFQEFINEKLGDKYVVEVYPSELLGSQTEMVQLTQTGAIDFVIASNAILETFSKNYGIFNLPFLQRRSIPCSDGRYKPYRPNLLSNRRCWFRSSYMARCRYT